MYASLVPRAIFPVYERLSGRRFWTEYGRLAALQWETPERLEARALARLRALLGHAITHVPYYRDLYQRAGVGVDNIRTAGDLNHLPIARKTELRDRYPVDTTADNLPASRRWKTATSGSTGFPFEFFTDVASQDRIAAGYLFFLGWAGVGVWHARVDIANRPGHPMSSILPAPSAVRRLGRRALLGERVVGLSGVDLRPGTFVAACGRLPRRGYFVRGLPSHLTRLAGRLLDEGVRLPAAPRVVMSFAETLSALDGDALTHAFGSPVVNQYSAWEAPHMAQTCPDYPGLLHVNSERVLLRVVRDDGVSAGPGEGGRILITALDNYVMPFINYEIGDTGVASDRCPCGRGLPTLASVEGRLTEAIPTRGGGIVNIATLDAVFRFAGAYVREYQAVETALGAVTLRIVPTARFTPEVGAGLCADLERLVAHGMTARVERVTAIGAEASGKRLLVKRMTAGSGGGADGPPGGTAADR